MTKCNPTLTPSLTTLIGTEKDVHSYQEYWEYPKIVGMMMLLSTNSHPDITYVVHQCARFTHDPK